MCHCTLFPWLLSRIYQFVMKDHVQSRDFQYPIYDPRHWGYSLPGREPKRTCNYDARAIYNYKAINNEELSFKQDELLHIYSNLGNGWLMAKKINFQEINPINNTIPPITNPITFTEAKITIDSLNSQNNNIDNRIQDSNHNDNENNHEFKKIDGRVPESYFDRI